MDTSPEAKDVFDLARIFWQEKIFIAVFTGAFALCAVAYSLLVTPTYTSSTLLSPKSGSSSGLARMASQYGALAGLAGVGLPAFSGGANKTDVAIASLKSFSFFEDKLYEEFVVDLFAADYWDESRRKLVYDEDVYDHVGQKWLPVSSDKNSAKPTAQEAHLAFSQLLRVSKDKQTDLVTIQVDHISPFAAQSWLTKILLELDDTMRQRELDEAESSIAFLTEQRAETNIVALDGVFANLIEEQLKNITLAMASETYIFDVIDAPLAPEKRSWPRRSFISLFGTGLGAVLALIIVSIKAAWRKKTKAE